MFPLDFFQRLGEALDDPAAKMLELLTLTSDWLEGIAILLTFNNYNYKALRIMTIVLYEKNIKVVTCSWH